MIALSTYLGFHVTFCVYFIFCVSLELAIFYIKFFIITVTLSNCIDTQNIKRPQFYAITYYFDVVVLLHQCGNKSVPLSNIVWKMQLISCIYTFEIKRCGFITTFVLSLSTPILAAYYVNVVVNLHRYLTYNKETPLHYFIDVIILLHGQI